MLQCPLAVPAWFSHGMAAALAMVLRLDCQCRVGGNLKLAADSSSNPEIPNSRSPIPDLAGPAPGNGKGIPRAVSESGARFGREPESSWHRGPGLLGAV